MFNCTLDKHDGMPHCTSECSSTKIHYDDDKHKLRSAYTVRSSDIETALSTHGPVEASFSVFADFTHYKTGVYKLYGEGTAADSYAG